MRAPRPRPPPRGSVSSSRRKLRQRAREHSAADQENCQGRCLGGGPWTVDGERLTDHPPPSAHHHRTAAFRARPCGAGTVSTSVTIRPCSCTCELWYPSAG